MDTAYVTLSRQSGLMNEMRLVANNIANANTTGYRAQGLVFSEFVRDMPGNPSLSMSRAEVRNTSLQQGVLTETGGQFDFAIEGDGFFMVETPAGNRLTRAGAFSPSADGDLVTMGGHRVLDSNGAPVFIPPDAASIDVGSDGTLSVDGQLLGQIGVYRVADAKTLVREGSTQFRAEGDIEPVEEPVVVHRFLEGSNVNAIAQVSRLVEIQRAYELGQSFLDSEHERMRGALKALVR
ncbi:flagellar hook-basal body complex protein [Ruegeria sp. Ofav3-42]|uniref:flagellar hook-basal body complex protein n=1 Tax=Ruegeria sp. Ofav3-42 TaxID=2917759 RepID=UPI001EF42EDE|nr:flagellar hook-basal body complex protein [Ruegeria sp. Ofav3-42]MCG7521701.1 flagellar hook-basal body complex protein [Ruegeria sp. Ofav3-42]